LADPQSQNPQRGTTTLAVLLNPIDQIYPKSVRQFQCVNDSQTLKSAIHRVQLKFLQNVVKINLLVKSLPHFVHLFHRGLRVSTLTPILFSGIEF
jgi:hypothetical protein